MQSAALLMQKKINQKFVLGKLKQRCSANRLHYVTGHAQQNAGFTLVEVLVVVIMVGVLAAIVAPSWLTFVNRQRVNKANDAVLTALQEAQREAKKTKRSYSVSFRTDSNVPQIAIYPSGSSPMWRDLGGDLGIQSGQLVLGTNLSNTTNTVSSPSSVVFGSITTPKTITFDYMGTLPNANFGTIPTGSTEPPGLRVGVAVPIPGSSTSASNVKRCVILVTLIGGMRTAKDTNCS